MVLRRSVRLRRVDSKFESERRCLSFINFDVLSNLTRTSPVLFRSPVQLLINMDIPPIHCCNMLTLENEKLAMKYHKLTKKYKVVEKRLQELTDQLKQEQIEKERQNFIERIVSPPAHSEEKVKYKLKDPKARSIPISKKKSGSSNIYQRKLNLSEDKTSRILSMHNELIKKYEKEMKLNTSRTEKITKLALEKSDLQRQLNDQREFIRELQKQLDAKERMQKCQQVKSRLTPKTTELLKSKP
eukprot:gene18990-20901_t